MIRLLFATLVVSGFLVDSVSAGGLALGLHNQHLRRRAMKGYKVPARIRWYARSFPGYYGQPSQRSGYRQPAIVTRTIPSTTHVVRTMPQYTNVSPVVYSSPPHGTVVIHSSTQHVTNPTGTVIQYSTEPAVAPTNTGGPVLIAP